MLPIISLIIVVAVSLLVVRIGAIALAMTGLSEDVAAFQAQSAFSGVGFTTSEAENVVNNPVRRRILRVLMLLGTAGISSVIATLIFTFIGQEESNIVIRFGGIVLGLGIVYLLTRLRGFNRILNRMIRRALSSSTGLHLYDYEDLLRVGKGYSIGQLIVKEGHWMQNLPLKYLNLISEGVLVLNIQRADGHTIETPTGDTVILADDKVICYGRDEKLTSLSERPEAFIPQTHHEPGGPPPEADEMPET